MHDVDIKEIELFDTYPEAFSILLRDHSRFAQFKQNHLNFDDKQAAEHENDPENLIIWATDDYVANGPGYTFYEPITVEKIIGENGMLIRPRCEKSIEEQSRRVKDKAEVFTPSWVCNAQNNLVDEAWFGRNNVFNIEVIDEEGNHSWKTTTEPINSFPEGKSWRDYVRDTRLEITCGEAPYIASRYDATTGNYIPTADRIGLIDRKLRIVSEHCHKSDEWLKMAQVAFQNTYGYEWQGDNLLLARESLLYTFLEFYFDKFGKLPQIKSVNCVADIISWNLWQMDGLKMVTPGSCEKATVKDLFGEVPIKCNACSQGERIGHVGIQCIVKNWSNEKKNQIVKFSSLLSN